jgi:hypothetical protein
VARLTAQITYYFLAARGLQFGFRDGLGVVLDCIVCKRTRRVVFLGEDERESTCTPTGHGFPGRVLGHETYSNPSPWPGGMRRSQHKFRLEYEYESFSDAKNGRPATPEPRWARIGLVLHCPKCGKETEDGTQSNIVLPRVSRCGCGKMLLQEKGQSFRFDVGDNEV